MARSRWLPALGLLLLSTLSHGQEPPPGLTPVVADEGLAEPSDALTGRDIVAALEGPCAEAGGCIVRLKPGVYRDVNISICPPRKNRRGACLAASSYPKGLVIEGAGESETTLQSPVPARNDRMRFPGVLSLDPSIDLPFFALRDLTLDGLSQKQPSYRLGNAQGERAHVSPHAGLRIISPKLETTELRVDRVTFRNFMSYGILARDVFGGWIRDSTVERIGCWNDVEEPRWFGRPVDGEVPCGCESPHAGSNCSGWEDERDLDTGTQVGVKMPGIGILASFGDKGGLVVERNELSFITKIALEASRQPTSDDPDDSRQSRNVTFRDNVVRKARQASTCNSCVNVAFVDNTFIDIGLQGTRLDSGACMGSSTAAVSGLRYEGNVCRNAMGQGIRIKGNGTGVTVTGNRISGVCTEAVRQRFTCRAIQIYDGDQKPELLRGLEVSRNEVTDIDGALEALLVRDWHDATIAEGIYEGGVHVQRMEGLELRDVVVRGGVFELGRGVRGAVRRCTLEKGARLVRKAGSRVELDACSD